MQISHPKLDNLTFRSILAFFFGMLLAAVHFTSLRLGAIGPIEVGLLIISVIVLFEDLVLNKKQIPKVFLVVLSFVLFFTLPITIANYLTNFYGSSISTIVAFLFGIVLGVSAQFLEKDHVFFGMGIAILMSGSLVSSIITGEIFAIVSRFAFLALNPNQLAFYALSSAFLVAFTLRPSYLRLIFLSLIIIYGSVTLSDAFFLSIAIALFALLIYWLIDKGIFGVSFFMIIFFLIFYIFNFTSINLAEEFVNFWYAADEGGGRIILIKNGFLAYLDSPFFGHGGGAFSGSYNPHGRFEAHNTVIDLLTIGGPILVIIFYFPMLFSIYFLRKNTNSIASAFLISALVFSIFHFVARHPIIWVVWAICLNICYRELIKYVWNFRSNRK